MGVCICHAVTERDIGSAVAAGCCCRRELREQLGVGAPVRPARHTEAGCAGAGRRAALLLDQVIRLAN